MHANRIMDTVLLREARILVGVGDSSFDAWASCAWRRSYASGRRISLRRSLRFGQDRGTTGRFTWTRRDWSIGLRTARLRNNHHADRVEGGKERGRWVRRSDSHRVFETLTVAVTVAQILYQVIYRVRWFLRLCQSRFQCICNWAGHRRTSNKIESSKLCQSLALQYFFNLRE